MRGAWIGSAIVKEVRFQDVMDVSRSHVGHYIVDLVAFLEVLELLNIDYDDSQTQLPVLEDSPHFHLENNTFEKEAEFLNVHFASPALLINNRFRSSLDFTGSTFETETSRLCLSNNRIQRPVVEPEAMGKPPGFSPYDQLLSLYADPLQTSRVRDVKHPECLVNSSPPSPTAQAQDESLGDIYKTLGRSFREANDRESINEAWYLQTLAHRRDQAPLWASLSWLLGDVPSRYTVDVWRTLWVSVFIMICFYVIYLAVLGGFDVMGRIWHFIRLHFHPTTPYHRVGRNRMVQMPPHSDRHRAFRFRLFEPMHVTETQTQRLVIPWWDAAMLSMRAFLKLGLGTRYPNSKLLKAIMYTEWAIGVFMLIHFVLAVKNNLPFILPFLGVMN
ncbi:MAG: hypothetical protein ETSY1_17860 [Candidatus Entotheonella factor]|uniref:Uncharacterized protein n=1 Tax=Entotheonella factor TaxID=1429438 RepID=W4LMR8_ENTF1|nr:MAG: hypothetical protein ETSY1_17860 [Candidatus Entotheonella factor]